MRPSLPDACLLRGRSEMQSRVLHTTSTLPYLSYMYASTLLD